MKPVYIVDAIRTPIAIDANNAIKYINDFLGLTGFKEASAGSIILASPCVGAYDKAVSSLF